MYVNVMSVSSYRKLYFVSWDGIIETGTVKGNKLCNIFAKLNVIFSRSMGYVLLRYLSRKHKAVYTTVSYSTSVHLNKRKGNWRTA